MNSKTERVGCGSGDRIIAERVGCRKGPGGPLTTLQAIVEDYRRTHPHAFPPELQFFRGLASLASLAAAVERAANCVDSRGKRFNHQRRIRKAAIQAARARLLSKIDAISRCRSFDELLRLVERELDPIENIGELYCYDTAARIGAYLRLMPEKVYLHAGTRQGARNLGLECGAGVIEVDALPAPLCDLAPFEAEDVLCIYKAELLRIAGRAHAWQDRWTFRGCAGGKSRLAASNTIRGEQES